MKGAWKTAALLTTLGTFLSAPTSSAWACTVCYGAADAPIIEGMNTSIVFMLGLTYFVIVGIAGSFVAVRLKSRRSSTVEVKGDKVQ